MPRPLATHSMPAILPRVSPARAPRKPRARRIGWRATSFSIRAHSSPAPTPRCIRAHGSGRIEPGPGTAHARNRRAIRLEPVGPLGEVALLQRDRRAVPGARAGAPPSLGGARQRRRIDEALGGDNAFKRGEPMAIVGLARVGIAGGLRFPDLLAKGLRPFLPGEHAAFVERHGKRKRLRLPRLAKPRPVIVARGVHGSFGAPVRRGAASVPMAISRYGSNASIDTVSEGSVASPHNSRPSNETV